MSNMKLEVIVGETGNSLRITLPQPIIRSWGVKKGDKLEMDLVNGVLLVNKKETST